MNPELPPWDADTVAIASAPPETCSQRPLCSAQNSKSRRHVRQRPKRRVAVFALLIALTTSIVPLGHLSVALQPTSERRPQPPLRVPAASPSPNPHRHTISQPGRTEAKHARRDIKPPARPRVSVPKRPLAIPLRAPSLSVPPPAPSYVKPEPVKPTPAGAEFGM